MDTGGRSRQFLEELAERILQSIREDQLIKTMMLDSTSGQFVNLRVKQIVDYIYKQDRESLILKLTDDNRSLHSQIDSLKTQLRNSEFSPKREITKSPDQDRLDRDLRELRNKVKDLEWERDRSEQQGKRLKGQLENMQRSSIREVDNSRFLQQLQNSRRKYKDQIDSLWDDKKRLQQELLDCRAQLSESKVKSPSVNVAAPSALTLAKLKDQLNVSQSQVNELKLSRSKDRLLIEDLQLTIKRLEKDIRQIQQQNSKQIDSIFYEHQLTLNQLKKKANQEIEETTSTYKRDKKAILIENQEALDTLVKVQRDELERNRVALGRKLEQSFEKIQILQKRNRELEQFIGQEKSRAQHNRHPRFSLVEIRRLHDQLSMKQAVYINLGNQKMSLLQELQRMVCERQSLVYQNLGLSQQVRQLSTQLQKLRKEALLLIENQTRKLKGKEEQIDRERLDLAALNQKLQDQNKILQQQVNSLSQELLGLRFKEKSLQQKHVTQEVKLLQLQSSRKTQEELHIKSLKELQDIKYKLLDSEFRLQQTYKDDQISDRIMQLQEERVDLVHQNQILKTDFEQITRQLRECFNNNRRLLAQNQTLKQELSQVTTNIQISRNTLTRNQVEQSRRSSEYIAGLQSLLQSNKMAFDGQKQGLLTQISQDRIRANQQFNELVDFIAQIHYRLALFWTLGDLRQRQSLVKRLEDESCRKVESLRPGSVRNNLNVGRRMSGQSGVNSDQRRREVMHSLRRQIQQNRALLSGLV